jgi:cytochrome c oxidase subunit II
MKMEAYEKLFLGLAVVVLVVFMGAIFWSVAVQGIVLPAPVQQVDPNTVASTAPFDQPGVKQVGPNEYEVVMTAKIWAFTPNEVTVPVGAKVKFIMTPLDVIHGFKIMREPVNVMLIPGQVSVVEHTFTEPGTYTYICHEYCGAGHQGMYGTITVTESAAAQPGHQVAETTGGTR